jgi:hypothetical protein
MKRFLHLARGGFEDPARRRMLSIDPPAPPPDGAPPPALTADAIRQIFREQLTEHLRANPPAPGPNPPAPPPPAPPVPPVPPVPPTPQENSELLRLRTQVESSNAAIEQLRAETAAAEKRRKEAELKTAITTSLSPFQFQTEKGAKHFREFVTANAVLNDDGTVVADGLTIDAYVEREINDFAGLLKAPAASGSGLQPGARGPQGPQIEDITVENMMDPGKRAATLKEIQRVAVEAGFPISRR